MKPLELFVKVVVTLVTGLALISACLFTSFAKYLVLGSISWICLLSTLLFLIVVWLASPTKKKDSQGGSTNEGRS